jgi:hypothetical protein
MAPLAARLRELPLEDVPVDEEIANDQGAVARAYRQNHLV